MNREELAIATWGILEKYVDTAKMVEVMRAVTVEKDKEMIIASGQKLFI